MKRKRLIARRIIAIAVAMSFVSALLISSPALAARTPGPGPHGSAIMPGVVAQPDGWLLYRNTMLPNLALTGVSTITISGKKAGDGTCIVQSSGRAGGTTTSATYEEEVAYNPKTCQERVTSGTLSPAGEAKLAASDSASRAAGGSGVTAQSSAVKARTGGKSPGGHQRVRRGTRASSPWCSEPDHPRSATGRRAWTGQHPACLRPIPQESWGRGRPHPRLTAQLSGTVRPPVEPLSSLLGGLRGRPDARPG